MMLQTTQTQAERSQSPKRSWFSHSASTQREKKPWKDTVWSDMAEVCGIAFVPYWLSNIAGSFMRTPRGGAMLSPGKILHFLSGPIPFLFVGLIAFICLRNDAARLKFFYQLLLGYILAASSSTVWNYIFQMR